jgi:hypothetical protein
VKTPLNPRSAALRRFGVSITALTILGHTVLGFEQAYATPVIAVLAAIATELLLDSIDAAAYRRPPRYVAAFGKLVDFLLPAYIAGLAIAMLLYANDNLWPYVLAAIIAISSKYLVRVRVGARLRHVLNPSNAGIVAILLLFPWVGIAPPYEFTEWVSGPIDALIPALLLVAGTMLNATLTRKIPLILGWVGGFVMQALVRGAFEDISLISALLPVTGVAFVLFTNYMITDPSTTPVRPRAQVAFGAGIAAVYGVLVALHVVFGLFFALTIVCALRGVGMVVVARTGMRTKPAAKLEPALAPPVAESLAGSPEWVER